MTTTPADSDLSGDALLDAYNLSQRLRLATASALRAAERALAEAQEAHANAELMAYGMGEMMRLRNS